MSKLKKNIASGLTKQIISILYGFVLPHLILVAYGSKVNGLINSVSQFLSLVSFLDLGVNVVVESALYKPLADNDSKTISEIMTSAKKFFHLIARILLLYVIGLSLVYPITVRNEFGFPDVVTIIIVLSIGSFAEFYFGIINSTLLRADQKSYIYDWLSVLVYILTTFAGILLIKTGASIRILKLATALIFLIRPVYISVYVKRNYNINFCAEYDEEPIKQKWNGMAQHFSAMVIDSTDIVVLTFFSSLQNVSVYSVYNLVVSGVKTLVTSTTHGVSAHFGSIIASGDKDRLYNSFSRMEWTIHTVTLLIFGCTSVLILPFIKIYTGGVTDVNYIVPLFAVLITIAQMMRCIRLPYNIIILAAGHYRQTQSNYIVAAIMNIGISVLLVMKLGLVGVAIGTIAAFVYQNIWMAVYISRNIVFWPLNHFIRQHLIDALIFLLAFLITWNIHVSVSNYFEWALLGAAIFLIWAAISVAINFVFYKDFTIQAFKRITQFV